MPPRAQPVRPKDDFSEQAKKRRRKPGKWNDFTALVNKKKKRRKPAYLARTDGQRLFYHGKENAIYSETEAGKDMLLAETVAQAIESANLVCWIDFEEGDEVDTGLRLLELGVEPEWICDKDKFLHATPEDVEQARDAIHEAITLNANIIIINGVQAAYALFGWDPFDPAWTAIFRNELIRPCLNAGRTVIETDHPPKSSAESKHNGSRYAAGGVAKLNWVTGAAYILKAKKTIIRGGNGCSELFLTKDRPGGIKPKCVRVEDEPRMMYAGTMNVRSVKTLGSDKYDYGYELEVNITPPNTDEPIRLSGDDIRKQNLNASPKSTTNKQNTQDKIWEILDRPMSPAAISKKLGISRQSVKDALGRGKKDGRFLSVGDGTWERS